MFTVLMALALQAGPTPHEPCKFEDSRNCVWDAKHMGNQHGRSFIDRNGKITFVSHKRAHRLLGKI